MTTPLASASGLALELLEVGDDEDRVEQVVEALLGLGRHVDELGVAAPVGGLQVELRHLGAHARRVGALLVDLVDRDEDRDVGGAGVVDRLAAVCGMTPSSAATTMTAMSATCAPRARMAVNASWPGRVEEGDRPAVVVDLVGADVLRDAAGLARGDLGLADGVEQRRLAVVDVAHDRHDRRALDEILVGVLEDRLVLGLVAGVDDLDLLAELLGEDGIASSESVWVSVTISPMLISFLMTSGDGDAEVLGDVLDGRAGVDADDVGAAHHVGVERRGDLLEHLAAAAAAAAAPGDGRRPPAAGRRDRPGHRDRRDRGARPAGR